MNNDNLEVVASVARIEQNMRLNGGQNPQENSNMPYIPDAETGKGLKPGEGVSALTFVSPLAYKVIIHLHDQRVSQDMIQNMDQNLRVTKGQYMIKYIPKTDHRYKKGRPWCIGQDLIRMGIYVSGPKHWNYLCDRVPELDWLRRNSTLTKEWFDIAAQHPGMSFWFSVDWPRYVAKILSQPVSVQKAGTGPEPKPLVAYKCSGEEYRKHYKDKCATLRVLGDVLKEVQEAEELPAVQKEMLDNAGETGITREQYIKGRGGVHQPIDPKTGRFISRHKED